MQTRAKSAPFLCGLIAGLGLMSVGPVKAQTFMTLHTFSPSSGTNVDGGNPAAGLILSGNTLYGTTYNGSASPGTVFKIGTDGGRFEVLSNFKGTNDGAEPEAGLILSGNTLYGTTTFGGSWHNWYSFQGQYQWHGLYQSL